MPGSTGCGRRRSSVGFSTCAEGSITCPLPGSSSSRAAAWCTSPAGEASAGASSGPTTGSWAGPPSPTRTPRRPWSQSGTSGYSRRAAGRTSCTTRPPACGHGTSSRPMTWWSRRRGAASGTSASAATTSSSSARSPPARRLPTPARPPSSPGSGLTADPSRGERLMTTTVEDQGTGVDAYIAIGEPRPRPKHGPPVGRQTVADRVFRGVLRASGWFVLLVMLAVVCSSPSVRCRRSRLPAGRS